MNIYADRGNILVLRGRCEARGIRVEVSEIEEFDTIDPDAHDLFYIGGGQDRDQQQIAVDMRQGKRDALRTAADDGATILAVCGGYQLLGHSYELGETAVEGLGLGDFKTVREPGPRLVGDIAIEVELDGSTRRLAGFENHGGRTYLNDSRKALGRVIAGHGNNGVDGGEGFRDGNVFGTYLHGPLLPKNAWFADHLIELALSRGGPRTPLQPLSDELENMAHQSAVDAALKQRRRSGILRRGRRAR